MLAKDIMTSPVVTVGPDSSSATAAALLTEHGLTALPVVRDVDHLVGIVTASDLRRGRALRASSPQDDDPERPDESVRGTVGEVMTTPVCAMEPGRDVADLARAMLEEGISSIPVVEGSRVVGIVTARDLIRVLARDDTAIAADVRHRLVIYGGFDRWTVRVEHGVVTVEDEFDDPTERHVVTVLVLTVPGVRDVRVRPVARVPAQR